MELDQFKPFEQELEQASFIGINFEIENHTSEFGHRNTLKSFPFNNNYVIQTAGFKGNWLPWKGLVLNSEVTHYRYDGLGAAFNQRYWLWNAAIGYKFLKNKLGEIRISAFDLLNQNTNISRTVTETYIEDNRTRVLNRYFLMTFTYTLRNYGVGNKKK